LERVWRRPATARTTLMNRYFDNNATTPLCAAAREAWIEASKRFWQNPSSLYRDAAGANRRLEDAREELADILAAEPEQIVFTGGATEANNALFQHVSRHQPDRPALISGIEHPSVRAPALEYLGTERTLEIPVTPAGRIDLDPFDRSIAETRSPAIVSLMAANNETGVLQPWQEIAQRCREHGVPYHCDAAQWIGKLPARPLGECDFVTGCAHKFGGPKGTGFLKLPESASRFEIFTGGPQESGHRAGTEDLPGILAMMAALREKNDAALESQSAARTESRNAFESAVTDRLPGVRVVAADAPRLWNTVMVIVPEHKNLKWLTRLDRRGFAVSTGSACSAGKGNPSHVMAAMGLDHDDMGRVIRISGGWETTTGDWLALADAFVEVAGELASGKRSPGALLA